VIEPTSEGLVLKEVAPGVSRDRVLAATEASLIVPPRVPEMSITA
jgi:acetate CoA/acetoacetate CoA-transferase beta subunit